MPFTHGFSYRLNAHDLPLLPDWIRGRLVLGGYGGAPLRTLATPHPSYCPDQELGAETDVNALRRGGRKTNQPVKPLLPRPRL